MYYLTNKLNIRKRVIYIYWILVSMILILFAAICTHSDFSSTMNVSFSVGVQLLNWISILFNYG